MLVGELDIPEMKAITAHVAGSVPRARLVSVPQATHLPSLERPEAVNPLLVDFLGPG